VILSLDENLDNKWVTNYGGLYLFPITIQSSSDAIWNTGTIDCDSFLQDNEFASFYIQTPAKPNASPCTINDISVYDNYGDVRVGCE